MSEEALYTKSGKPVAYLASDGETIYLWSGHAVAYLDRDTVYGWKGKHLDWWDDGIIYDLHGRRIGFTGKRCPSGCFAAPAKYDKYAQYAKYARFAPYARPAFSFNNSEQELEDFLKQNAVGA